MRQPTDPPLTNPAARDVFGNPGAAGRVWHCHILEHEDQEMMRPFVVLPASNASRDAGKTASVVTPAVVSRR